MLHSQWPWFKTLGALLLVFTCLLPGFVQAQATTAATVTYIYTNAQGSPLAKADEQGNIIARYTYRPYGTQQSGPTNKGPGYTGHVNDPATGLVYMQQRYYDPSIGRFISPDPVGPAAGNVFNFGRYTYANDNPIVNMDPDGRDCTTSDGVTTCFTKAYRVSFTAQPGFQDFTSTTPNYHFYTVPKGGLETPGRTLNEVRNYLVKHPAPGSSKPATPQGTPNNATPIIGGIIASPVMSFTGINQLNGKPVVINVTLPGHKLASGIVVRQATQSSDGHTSIQTWGEGISYLQASGSFPGVITGPVINSIWEVEGPPSLPNPTGCSNAAGTMNNVCNK